MKPTKLNTTAIQALVFTLYMRSYLHETKEMTGLILVIINERQYLPSAVQKDLLWLLGKQVCQLIKPLNILDGEGVDSPLSLIM